MRPIMIKASTSSGYSSRIPVSRRSALSYSLRMRWMMASSRRRSAESGSWAMAFSRNSAAFSVSPLRRCNWDSMK